MAHAGGKKLVNKPESIVEESLHGFVALNPGLQLLDGLNIVIRSDISDVIKAKKVTIISGGGSGHEPAHAGFVGRGMLSAAVAGHVFSSPPPACILAAIRAVGTNNPAGVLVVIKNYTGDRLNFGLAAERAKAEGIKTEIIMVGEDCALASTDKTAGRRGLCGTIFVHKIAGAMAEEGKSLEEILKTVTAATQQMGTIGLCLSPCSIPGSGPSFQLKEDEMELGLGIHGEAGIRRMKLCPAADVVRTMMNHLTDPQSETHMTLRDGNCVACIVNNLGGTSVLEMNLMVRETVDILERRGIAVQRLYSGSLMTSLDMAGISISILHLDANLKKCLDADTDAPGWVKPRTLGPGVDRVTPQPMPVVGPKSGVAISYAATAKLHGDGTKLMYTILGNIGRKLQAEQDRLNTLDKEAGDGDCGSTLARGAQELLKRLGASDSPGLPVDCPAALAHALADIAESTMGGSSGALYSIFLATAAQDLQTSVTAADFVNALQHGTAAVQKYGGAKPGYRTMLDPLNAIGEFLTGKHCSPWVFQAAVKEGEHAAEQTATMQAGAGRASYISKDRLSQPDPGATAVVIWMKEIATALN